MDTSVNSKNSSGTEYETIQIWKVETLVTDLKFQYLPNINSRR